MRVSYDLSRQLKKNHYFPSKKCILLSCAMMLIIFLTVIFGNAYLYKTTEVQHKQHFVNSVNNSFINDDDIDQQSNMYFIQRQFNNFSKLGEILYLNRPYPNESSAFFTILIWREGQFLERRHINYFTKERHDPFEKCSVNNCNITYKSSEIDSADAVVFYLQKLESSEDIPVRQPQHFNQRWIFLTDQSPFNTFQFRENNDWRNYSNVFNWSMTYKMEADIPIPYGRTVSLLEDNQRKSIDIEKLIPFSEAKQHDVLVAVKTLDCLPNKKRMIYVTELQKYLNIDVYGKCAKNTEDICSRMSDIDCPKLNRYLFYLSFENSNCDQFMTENLFWVAYSKGAIPIIMGPTVENCQLLLPPNSFIHIENYTNPAELADYILQLNNTRKEHLLKYHEWRRYFTVLNEHGYYGASSMYYCRICQALNYNDRSIKTYSDLSTFLSVEKNCRN